MVDDEHAVVTLRDIAERAGVSVASVSRALSGRGELQRATRERVLSAASELGYTRPAGPKGRPTTLDPRLIELVLGSFDDSWTDAITTGARQAAFRLGFDLVLTLEREDPDDDWPARVVTRRPSGVIIGIIRPTQRQLTELSGLRIPIVLLEPRSDPGGALASVGTADWEGGYEAGHHLALSGCCSFVVLTGSPPYRFGRAREEGFRQAIKDARGDAPITHVDSQWTDAQVTHGLLNALSSDDLPIGVFACNDEMALATYRAASLVRRRIPDEISVIGFNDEPRALIQTPPLTTIRQPLTDIAARAVEIVADLRHHGNVPFDRVELPSTLIVRGSTLPLVDARQDDAVG